MREHNKKWLISIMKTSGSKRHNLVNGSYSDDRHLQNGRSLEDLPHHESIKSTRKFYNGKINFALLVRFLRGQVGNDWDAIYSEIIARIPSKLLDYENIVFWFVADKVDFKDGRPWNKKTQRFIWTGEPYLLVCYKDLKTQPEFTEFYIDPQTNKLVHIPQKNFKKIASNR